jgi:hypothetical protein
MRFRPGLDVPFLCLEAILIGGHYAFPDLPHLLGLVMFWVGIAGVALWGLLRFGVFDDIDFLQRWAGSVTPKRDVGVAAAIAYICYRNWDQDVFTAAGSSGMDAARALKDFQQAAADGDVPVWGIRDREIYEPIPAEFWRRHQVEWFDLLKGKPTTEPMISASDRGERFKDLMTSRARVEELWPKKKGKLVFRLPWEMRLDA